MTEYHIIFKENEEGSMEVFAEVIGEDHTPITNIGDYFYGMIQSQLEKFAEELESE